MTRARRLAHVFWLGGSPCSGKSTAADRLAVEHDMIVYRCDDAFHDHMMRADPVNQPVLHRLASATTDEIWLRPVQQQIGEELEIYREQFPMILADLLATPASQPIIADGAALLPELLHPTGFEKHRMVWMVPTPEFQRAHYEQRDWRHDVLRDCSNPEQGWENWMSRDAGFAQSIALQAKERDLPLITTDGSRSLDDTYRVISQHFRLPSA